MLKTGSYTMDAQDLPTLVNFLVL